MENVQDALIMAFSVLIFVLALGLSITNLTSARVTSQYIASMADREYWTSADDYVSSSSGSITRTVGIESVIHSMYRAYKENYKIYFFNNDGSKYILYEKTVGANTYKVNYIDLEGEVYANQTEAVNHLNNLLSVGDSSSGYSSLYDRLKGHTFTEELGEYYQEDQNGVVDNTVPESNKTKKRVITYIAQQQLSY